MQMVAQYMNDTAGCEYLAGWQLADGKHTHTCTHACHASQVYADAPHEAVLTYNTLEHSGHTPGEMAVRMPPRQREAIRRMLLANRHLTNAEIITQNLEQFFAPVRAQYPEKTEAEIRQHLADMKLPREFFVTHADVENIRQVSGVTAHCHAAAGAARQAQAVHTHRNTTHTGRPTHAPCLRSQAVARKTAELTCVGGVTLPAQELNKQSFNLAPDEAQSVRHLRQQYGEDIFMYEEFQYDPDNNKKVRHGGAATGASGYCDNTHTLLALPLTRLRARARRLRSRL